MRTLSGGLTTELGKVLTQCTWLLKIVTTAQTIRGSTEGEVTWNSQTWSAIGARIERGADLERVEISLPNEDGAVLAQVAAGEMLRAETDLYVMYPGASDATHFMRGYVANVSGLMADRATLAIERFANATSIVPTVTIGPPGWTKLPPPNLRFEWGGNRIELEQPSNA